MSGIRSYFIFILLIMGRFLFSESGSIFTINENVNYYFEDEPAVYDPGIFTDINFYFFQNDESRFQYGLDLGYTYLPLKMDDSASFLEVGGLTSYLFPLGKRAHLRLDALAGLNIGTLNSVLLNNYDNKQDIPWGTGAYFGLKTNIHYYLNPDLMLKVEMGYRNALDLYSSVNAGIGVGFHIPATGSQLHILKVESSPVIPAFKEYYLENPVLRVDLKNDERFSISDLSLRVEKGELNEEGPWINVGKIETNDTSSVYLPVNWTNDILKNNKTSTENINIKITYSSGGKKRTIHQSHNCLVLGKNAFIWQNITRDSLTGDAILDKVISADDGKAAVFVNPNDEEFISLSSKINEIIKSQQSRDHLDPTFRNIMASMAYLKEQNLRYQTDPNSIPYGSTSDKQLVDYLRYPAETLVNGYGDCDDLSILTASLLEASGIHTAFVTIPGHIFLAAKTQMDKLDIKRLLMNEHDFIKQNDSYWIPIETTMISEGMQASWETGSKEWNSTKNSERKIHPLTSVWQNYRPVKDINVSNLSPYIPTESLTETFTKTRYSISQNIILEKLEKLKKNTSRYSDKIKSYEYNKLSHIAYTFGDALKAYDFIKLSISFDKNYSNCLNAGIIAKNLEKKDEAIQYANAAIKIRNDIKSKKILSYINQEINAGLSEILSGESDQKADEVVIEFPWSWEDEI